jgi:hypothetical protein
VVIHLDDLLATSRCALGIGVDVISELRGGFLGRQAKFASFGLYNLAEYQLHYSRPVAPCLLLTPFTIPAVLNPLRNICQMVQPTGERVLDLADQASISRWVLSV